MYKAFVACPSIDECAVHTEVFTRKQALCVSHLQHLLEQLNDRVVLDQPLREFTNAALLDHRLAGVRAG
jgi:hypothetical protein